MRTKDFLTKGVDKRKVYSTPLVDVLSLRTEGMLCQSYGDINKPGKDLDEENVWDF